ncbi:MAG: alpha/beta hydrolase [Acidobacteria bacterium]|nr:MAG: alpha/beta hydrolase [Acidobacteriota bacterium]
MPTTSDLPLNSRTVLRYTLPSLAVAGGAYALERVRSRYQDRIMFLPTRYPTGIWDPSPYGLEVEDHFFEAADGTRLHGWWIPHARARGTLLYCHGNSGSVADRIGIFRQLRRLKVQIFAFDYRGYGRSEGEPTEAGVCDDARAAFDHLTATVGIDPQKVIFFGHSLGGAVAIDLALHRPAVALVAQSSFTDMRDMASHLFAGSPIRLMARNAFRSIEKVGQLTLPKLFIHGTEDGTVPFEMGQRLFAAAAEPKQWYAVPHAGHNDVHRFGGFRYYRTLSRFLRAHF